VDDPYDFEAEDPDAPAEVPYTESLAARQETFRSRVGMGLIVVAYGLVAVTGIGYLFGFIEFEEAVRTTALLTVLTSVASAAVGYYFGRSGRR
jgi:hypothetical protein